MSGFVLIRINSLIIRSLDLLPSNRRVNFVDRHVCSVTLHETHLSTLRISCITMLLSLFRVFFDGSVSPTIKYLIPWLWCRQWELENNPPFLFLLVTKIYLNGIFSFFCQKETDYEDWSKKDIRSRF